MKKEYLLLFFLAACLNSVSSQTHTAVYEDERYMVCTFKGFYNHCIVKHELEDGKWMFFYSGTNNLAVVAHIKDKTWNGYYYTYRENGSLSSMSTYQNDRRAGEYRSYWPNGQMHFKMYEPYGELLVLDSLGKITRQEKPSIDTPFRKPFVPLNLEDILKYFDALDTSMILFSKDSILKLTHYSVQNISIHEIQSNESAKNFNKCSQWAAPLIGISREELLNNLGTDYYIMTESFIDYSLDANGSAILDINCVPKYFLRCCLENDIVEKLYVVDKNKDLSFRAISLLLSNLPKTINDIDKNRSNLGRKCPQFNIYHDPSKTPIPY